MPDFASASKTRKPRRRFLPNEAILDWEPLGISYLHALRMALFRERDIGISPEHLDSRVLVNVFDDELAARGLASLVRTQTQRSSGRRPVSFAILASPAGPTFSPS